MEFNNELDGRDAIVKQHFKDRKDLLTRVERPEQALVEYQNPWEPAWYSQFDDLRPMRVADYETQGKLSHWVLPITDVDRHDGRWYSQVEVGTLEICEAKKADGTSEWLVSIRDD